MMKPFLKILIVGLFAMAGVIGILEARQVSQFHDHVQSLKQQQRGLAAQISQLEQERDDARNRLAALQTGNESSEPDTNRLELLYLRGETSRLEANEAASKDDPTDAAEDAWLTRVNQLKQYVEQHPNDALPEFQYLTPREWLMTVNSTNATDLATAMGMLKSQAEGRFAIIVSQALANYSKANNGQFPDDLSQLQPYGDADMENILQQRYEIKPVSVLDQNTVRFSNIKSDHVIATQFIQQNGQYSHIAIYPGGYAYF